MELKSMKLSEEDQKEEMSQSPIKEGDGPEYPYGLRLRIDEDEIEKLGLGEDMPELKTKFRLSAIVEVCSASQNSSVYGDSKVLELQITDMGLSEEGAEA